MAKKKERQQQHAKKKITSSYAEVEDDNNSLDDRPSTGSSKKLNFRRFKRNTNHPSSKKQQQQSSSKRDRHKSDKSSNNNSNNGDDVTFRKALERDGTRTVVDMASDGNCLFRSLADQIYTDHGYHHDQVRAKVCDFMEQHQDEFSGFLVLDETESDHDAQDFASYIAAMREDGEWGGNLELVAAARCYGRNITVFSAPLAAFTIECGEIVETQGPDLQLSYHDNDHYNSVRLIHGISKKQIQPQPSSNNSKDKNIASSLSSKSYAATAAAAQPVKKKETSLTTKSSVSHSEEEGDAVEVELQEQDEHNDDGNNEGGDQDITSISPNLSTTTTATSVDSTSVSAATLEPDKHVNLQHPVNGSKLNQRQNETTTNGGVGVVIQKRNGLCPCGSGLRYKKCCLAKEKHVARLKKLHGHDENKEDTTAKTKLQQRCHLDDGDDDGENNKDQALMINGHFRVLKI